MRDAQRSNEHETIAGLEKKKSHSVPEYKKKEGEESYSSVSASPRDRLFVLIASSFVQIEIGEIFRWMLRKCHCLVVEDHPMAIFQNMRNIMATRRLIADVGNEGD